MPPCKNPNCERPGRSVHHNEKHDICIWCLGPDHDPYQCSLCQTMSASAKYKRNKIRLYRIEHGVWPDLAQELVMREGSVCSRKSRKSEVSVPYSVPKSNPNAPHTLSKPPGLSEESSKPLTTKSMKRSSQKVEPIMVQKEVLTQEFTLKDGDVLTLEDLQSLLHVQSIMLM
jgi:hypothetical protein